MAAIGRTNCLQVVKQIEIGIFLDGGPEGEILLPRRYVPEPAPQIGEFMNVFVYLDSEDRPIATTQRPRVEVGQFASLKVKEINQTGIFLDWGLPKDLMLPYSERKRPMEVGKSYVVYVYVDQHTHRPVATARLDRHLDLVPAKYKQGEEVDVLVAERTDLGFKVIINHQHWGLLHHHTLFKDVRIGQRERGFIQQVRADGKIDISLQLQGKVGAQNLSDDILAKLRAAGGSLPFSDKSNADEIVAAFGVSKGNFKKAIGGLYKKGQIAIFDDRIELVK
ncbi:MAG: GntR family transcriptional regulator [Oceanospirillaceae bacterium]|nr:GntR family transcriptional regulator [Oceanospirillaceae bacterium]MCP5349459.1 GntR family transcriptional regulator [Oceanospirillaceae bacterium]